MRVRATRSSRSRPRTRIRPAHSGAIDGFVVAVDRGRYTCVVDGHEVTAMRARELGRKSVVVGDEVGMVGDVSGVDGSLARIVRINDRRSVLMRTADDDDTTAEGRLERVVVANADQMAIVSALADPPPRTGFIDRCLVAAYAAGIEPLLCLTKADIGGPEAVLDYYASLEVPHLLLSPGAGLEPLRTALRGKVSVFVGHSGVGKSTLVNRLIPAAGRAVGVVSAIGKGRHTSTSAVALRLPGREEDSWIIDTPGIRSFGLAHVSADDLLHGFTDLVEGTTDCPPNCEHLGEECALDTWVAEGHADPRRLASYRRLLLSRAGEPDSQQPSPDDHR